MTEQDVLRSRLGMENTTARVKVSGRKVWNEKTGESFALEQKTWWGGKKKKKDMSGHQDVNLDK